MTLRSDGFIGVFDSGVGGTSVLRALARELPHEDFNYFGDSAHNPYGEKDPSEVLGFARAIVRSQVEAGAKAVVIACNTATAAAAEALRAEYPDLPIIGIEPALKPAVAAVGRGHGRVLVMATPMTLHLQKYQELARACGKDDQVVSVPCPGLAARIEKGDLDAPDLAELVRALVGEYAGTVDAVVLGCTHYPFIRPLIARVLGPGARFFDGNDGTARQLRARLRERGLLAERERAGRVSFASSTPGEDELALYERFFNLRAANDGPCA